MDITTRLHHAQLTTRAIRPIDLRPATVLVHVYAATATIGCRPTGAGIIDAHSAASDDAHWVRADSARPILASDSHPSVELSSLEVCGSSLATYRAISDFALPNSFRAVSSRSTYTLPKVSRCRPAATSRTSEHGGRGGPSCDG